jgi:hypothetical protein
MTIIALVVVVMVVMSLMVGVIDALLLQQRAQNSQDFLVILFLLRR